MRVRRGLRALFRRRRRTHWGIDLQVSFNGGVLIRADSDHLYLVAKYGGVNEKGWAELLRTTEGFLIEAKPVILTEEDGNL